MTDAETGVYIMLGGMLLFAAVLALLDWYGRRKERKTRERRLIYR